MDEIVVERTKSHEIARIIAPSHAHRLHVVNVKPTFLGTAMSFFVYMGTLSMVSEVNGVFLFSGKRLSFWWSCSR